MSDSMTIRLHLGYMRTGDVVEDVIGQLVVGVSDLRLWSAGLPVASSSAGSTSGQRDVASAIATGP